MSVEGGEDQQEEEVFGVVWIPSLVGKGGGGGKRMTAEGE